MRIEVNGDPLEVDAALTVAALLARLQLVAQRVAVEVNEELVRRGQFAEARLAEGDRVEIVTLVEAADGNEPTQDCRLRDSLTTVLSAPASTCVMANRTMN